MIRAAASVLLIWIAVCVASVGYLALCAELGAQDERSERQAKEANEQAERLRSLEVVEHGPSADTAR